MEKLISNLYKIKINDEPKEASFARVSACPFNRSFPGYQRNLDQSEESAFVSFEMGTELVLLEIEPSFAFDEVVIRPLSKKIIPQTDGTKIYITISKPGQFVLELDGMHHALHIFANPGKEFILPENTLYFGKGVHHPGVITLEDDMTVYIDKDAVVYGAIEGIGVKNATICGYGVLDGGFFERVNGNYLLGIDVRRFPDGNWEKEQMKREGGFDASIYPPMDEPYVPGSGTKIYESREQFSELLAKMNTVKTGISLYNCENIRVDGIIFRDSAGLTFTSAGCKNINVNNIKMVGMWRYNSDGIDFYNCSDCSVKNSFFRNFDDCICVKGQVGWDKENSENILIEKCITWNDWGNSLEFGADSVANEIRNITFRDCDCIHGIFGVMDIRNQDRAHIHDVLYENIRAEYSKYDPKPAGQSAENEKYMWEHGMPNLVEALLGCGMWSDDNILGSIENVVFRNIEVLADDGIPFPKIVFLGRDKKDSIRNITFENVTFNGEKVAVNPEVNEFVGEFVIK